MLFIGSILFLLLKRKFLLAVGAGVVVISAVLIFANPRIEGLNPFRTASTTARIKSTENALEIIKDHMLLGVGFNAYRSAQVQCHFREETTVFPSHADSGTDNSFLFVFATTGVLGFSVFLYFLSSLWKQAGTIKKGKDFSLAYKTGFICWCIGSFFLNGLFYPPLLFWMIMSSGITEE